MALSGWVVVPFMKTGHTEASLLRSELVPLSNSARFQPDEDLRAPSGEAERAPLFSILQAKEERIPVDGFS